ncbi:uncharacterized protein LOC141527229 [Cotesia typhae]|uniref:uncharacterized protein LOC141527229 n=1 Tax=Cotesia typhae TaxID=2053667 RepID=UPI003D684974
MYKKQYRTTRSDRSSKIDARHTERPSENTTKDALVIDIEDQRLPPPPPAQKRKKIQKKLIHRVLLLNSCRCWKLKKKCRDRLCVRCQTRIQQNLKCHYQIA